MSCDLNSFKSVQKTRRVNAGSFCKGLGSCVCVQASREPNQWVFKSFPFLNYLYLWLSRVYKGEKNKWRQWHGESVRKGKCDVLVWQRPGLNGAITFTSIINQVLDFPFCSASTPSSLFLASAAALWNKFSINEIKARPLRNGTATPSCVWAPWAVQRSHVCIFTNARR